MRMFIVKRPIQIKLNYKVFILVIGSVKAHLTFFPISDSDETVSTLQVQFCEDTGIFELFQNERHQQLRISLLDYYLVPSSIVNESSSFFLHKEESSICKSCGLVEYSFA